MDKNLVDAKVAIHQKQVERLKELESELIKMIAELGNEAMQDKMLEWMNQRTRCNETYVATLNVMTE
tara:strand:+ start:746 stop:946 length:201 start_codon:yes stop_codon:yes gene_type:complete